MTVQIGEQYACVALSVSTQAIKKQAFDLVSVNQTPAQVFHLERNLFKYPAQLLAIKLIGLHAVAQRYHPDK